jgi:hypothetical protein
MHQATSTASFAPCRRNASNTASTNRYSTSISARSRPVKGEGLVVLPQPVGDLTDRALADQQLPGRVRERVLDIPSGQATRVHLGNQSIQHVTVAIEKAHQRRPERRHGPPHLRHRHLEQALGSADPTRLVTIARADLTLLAALVPAPAAQPVGLLALDQLLQHQPGHRLDQRGDNIALTIDTARQQLLQLFPGNHRRRYLSHGLLLVVGPQHPT